jgi:hypothetical protein
MSDDQSADPVLHISLSLSAWTTVLAHLQLGAYQTVAAIIRDIAAQSNTQLEAKHRAEAAEQARLARSQETTETVIPRTH